MFPNRTLYLFWFCISCTSYAVQDGPLPPFDFKRIFLHPDQLQYSPNDDLIHPTIDRTTGRVKNPSGKYYFMLLKDETPAQIKISTATC